MHAMVLNALHTPLVWTELPDREPGPGQVRVEVGACGVCRTDMHVWSMANCRIRWSP
jgi:propanol-preferring alcohol dehydrogenase